jgi:putative MATE family efflux protein
MLIRKDVLKLTGPIVAEQAFVMIMGVINTMMAGHIGKEAVSAVGMVDSINNILISFFSALAVGGTVVVAHYTGQNNYKSANDAAKQALVSGTVLALAVTLITFLLRHVLVTALYGSAEQMVIENAITYLNITLLTYPLIAFTSVACGVLRGAGDTGNPMKVTIIMNILNIIFSYVLIYGIEIGGSHFHIDIPGLGIFGAALGIAIARTAGSVLIAFTIIRGSKLLKLSFDFHFRFDFEQLRSIFGIGFPASVESLLFNAGKLITQIFIVGMGTASIAANYIAASIFGLLNIPGAALSIAATTLVGQYMGRGESDEAKSTLTYLIKAASVSLFAMCALVFPFSTFIASLYTSSRDVIEIAAAVIRTSIITIPTIWSLSFLLPAGLKGAGDAKYTMAVSVFSMWAFRITMGYILGVPLKMGVMGVWIGMYIDWLVRAVLFYIRLQSGKWKKNVVVRNLEEAV